MENNKEMKIAPPQGLEVDKVEVVDGVLTVTFKAAEKKLPKSWEEFCEMFPKCGNSFYIDETSEIKEVKESKVIRFIEEDKNILPDRATAEAVLALCELIQLRNAYNGDWVPDWNNHNERKHIIIFSKDTIEKSSSTCTSVVPLYFKTEELRDEFLRNFRPLIEKLKPLYGIKEGGEE